MLISKVVIAQPPANKVCGKWESTDKNLIVEVYKVNGDFKAKIIWFDDGSVEMMRACVDDKNPDKALRTRKVLGMDVLTGLVYQPATDSWENGMVYDAKHGREWNAAAYINKHGELKVRGYWHFKFIGRTLTFYRV
jgi:uncharacterized protein (DUF2147 family)